MLRLFGSKHALVYCACFRIQPDINRGPQRESAGAFLSLVLLSRRHERLLQWDSFLLWKSLCVHKSLKKAAFVLLLNKYDLLDAKLHSGIKFRDYVTSYKDRPNKTETVLHCES
jgi:hypothetical protein